MKSLSHKFLSILILSTMLFQFAPMDNTAQSAAPEMDFENQQFEVASSFDCAAQTQIPQAECQALVELYNATNGLEWIDRTNWLETRTPSDWHGVTVIDGHVRELYLAYNGLMGVISESLILLNQIRRLELRGNKLEGELPEPLKHISDIGYLAEMESERDKRFREHMGELGIDLPPGLASDYSSNREYIPPTPEVIAETKAQARSFDCSTVTDVPEIECEALVALYESTNGAGWYNNSNWLITSSVNNWYGATTYDGSLYSLSLDGNYLIGSIPAKLGDLSNLQYLVLSYNQLSVTIPNELGALNNLQYLNLSHNQLSGTIPYELGALSNLLYLNLSSNQLSGSIPHELGGLNNLQDLNLSYNQLSGTIPNGLGALNNLQNLNLFTNQLSGSITIELGALSNLQYLNMSNNQLSGSIPSEFSNLNNLKILLLYENQLSGLIPSQLGALNNLSGLHLNNNQLSGPIPPQLGNLNKMQSLDLSENQLSGQLPKELGKMNNLEWLTLSFNQLSGDIPSELGSLINLEYLMLWNNQLSGEIPHEFGQLSNLVWLILIDNKISGNIPPQLGNLINLNHLSLGHNQLTGTIPPELNKMSNLIILGIEGNQLTGSLPHELGNLISLQSLFLYGNQLSGSIPLSFTNLINLEKLYFDYTYLCEPTTAEFQAWKSTVWFWYGTGINCSTPNWLLMYYFAGDNNLSKAILKELDNLRQTDSPNVDVAVFLDTKKSNSKNEFWSAEGNDIKIQKSDLNSGSGTTLSDFITWAKSQSHATNTALVIVDHGHGLSGVAWDDTSNKDYVTIKELKTALQTTGKVDVLFLHACLMANIEAMWELRGLTDYWVASESVMWLPFYHHNYTRDINNTTTPRELALEIAKAKFDFRDVFNRDTPSTISVTDMSQISTVFIKANALAKAIRDSSLLIKGQVWGILGSPNLQRFNESFPPSIDEYDRLVDLYHFALLVSEISELQPAAVSLLLTYNDLIIYNQKWSGYGHYIGGVPIYYWDHSNATGVSINLPTYSNSWYSGEWLTFAQGANWSQYGDSNQILTRETDEYHWGPMISELVLEFNPDDPDVSTPPDPVEPGIVDQGYFIFLPLLIR